MKTVLRLALMLLLVSPAMYAAVPNYVPTNGLVGWWPFNGNADDESGNGNNGSNNGATLNSDRFGSNNSCYYFQNNNILIPHNTLFGFQANSGFTISMWCNSSDFSNSLHFMGKRGNSSPYFNWQIAYGGNLIGPNFGSGTDPGIYNGAFSPDLLLINNWYHIVGKFNNGVWSIYVDGILKATNTTAMVNPDSNTPMTFGESGGFQGFIGKLDDIGIWNRALTDCEIQNLYTSTNPTNTTTTSACNSYTWNGQTYTSSGLYTGTTANCVTESLNLTITPSSTNTTTALACNSYTWNGQTYTQSGIYTGTTTDCVTQSLNLTITPSSTNTTTATSCDSYTWNGQAYIQSGIYTGTTTDCVTQSLNLTITPSSTITQPASQSTNITNNAQFIVGSSGSNAIYQWQTNLGFGFQNLNNAGQYNGTTSSTLSVLNLSMSNNNQVFRCIISSGSCTDTSAVAVLTVVNNAGINNINASKLSIYPNPTNGDITITGLELVGTVSSLSLTDMNGKVVKVLDTKATKFSMASIKPGVYFLNIRADNKQEVLKIVKE